MRSFEVATLEANCLGSRHYPKRHRAALIQRESEGIPSDPGIIVEKTTRFSAVQSSFNEGLHSD